MKVQYVGSYGIWWWSLRVGGDIHTSPVSYTRKSDAKRGFERFCAAIKKAGA